jgi:hypothetical protein
MGILFLHWIEFLGNKFVEHTYFESILDKRFDTN